MGWRRSRRTLGEHELEALELAFVARLTSMPINAPATVACALSAGVHPGTVMRWAGSDHAFAVRMVERLVASARARICERDVTGRTAERPLEERLELVVDRRMRQAEELGDLVAIVPARDAARLVASCAGELRRSVLVTLERWLSTLDPTHRANVVECIDDALSPVRIEWLRTLEYSEIEIREQLRRQVRRIVYVDTGGGVASPPTAVDVVDVDDTDDTERDVDVETPPRSADNAG